MLNELDDAYGLNLDRPHECRHLENTIGQLESGRKHAIWSASYQAGYAVGHRENAWRWLGLGFMLGGGIVAGILWVTLSSFDLVFVRSPI